MGQLVQVQSGQNQVQIAEQTYNSTERVIVTDDKFDRFAPGAFTSLLTDLGPSILASAPFTLVSATTISTTYATFSPLFRGTIRSFAAIVTTAGTGTGATAAFNISIGSSVVSGGQLDLTLAKVTPAGAVLSASNIIPIDNTGANSNTFKSGDTITIKTTATAITAFTAGAVVFVLFCEPTNSRKFY